jgi:hypothetical protein
MHNPPMARRAGETGYERNGLSVLSPNRRCPQGFRYNVTFRRREALLALYNAIRAVEPEIGPINRVRLAVLSELSEARP